MQESKLEAENFTALLEMVDSLNQIGSKIQTVSDSLDRFDGESAGAQFILQEIRDGIWETSENLNRYITSEREDKKT